MRGFNSFTLLGPGRHGPRRPLQLGASSRSITSASTTAPVAAGNPVLKAALTTGALAMAGDVLAQAFIRRRQLRTGAPTTSFDTVRAARMAGYGAAFYGPFQHFWYQHLERALPSRSLPSFGAKVFLNQAVLGPVVLSSVLLWNFGWTGQLPKLRSKVERDFVPTLVNGWKFWVPASCINFWLVPLQYRVLYMSTCGLLWTGYLSYTSN